MIDSTDDKTGTMRIRVTANMPPELHAQVQASKRPGESMSEAICRLIQMGMLADVAVTSAAAVQRNQKTFENIALVFMREMKEMKSLAKSFRSESN